MKDREEVTQALCMTRQGVTDTACLGMLPANYSVQYRMGALAKAAHET